MKIEGGCHCGLVRWEAYLPDAPATLLDCNCSICTMTGYLHLIVPETSFRQTEGKRDMGLYRFGTGAARHYFCTQCGIKSFYRPRSHPDSISLNWRCVDEGHGLRPAVEPFDGRHHPGRIG